MSTREAQSGAPSGRPRRLTAFELAVLWIAKVGAAGMLGYAAVSKLMNDQVFVEVFRRIGMGDDGRYLIGGLEIVAAILIVIPQSAIYGAFGGLGIMCGAIIGHLSEPALPISMIWRPLLVGALCVTVLYLRRHDAKFIRNLWDR